jgi:hypothetical protein
VEIERRLDGSTGCASEAAMCTCAAQNPSKCPQVLPAYGLQDLWNEYPEPKNKIQPKYHVPANHPWRKSWNRTFLSSGKPDISTLR